MENIKYNEMVWNTIRFIDLRKTHSDSINQAQVDDVQIIMAVIAFLELKSLE